MFSILGKKVNRQKIMMLSGFRKNFIRKFILYLENLFPLSPALHFRRFLEISKFPFFDRASKEKIIIRQGWGALPTCGATGVGPHVGRQGWGYVPLSKEVSFSAILLLRGVMLYTKHSVKDDFASCLPCCFASAILFPKRVVCLWEKCSQGGQG